MNASAPSRPKHRGAWFVTILGLIEIALLVAIFANHAFANAACGIVGAAPVAIPAANGPDPAVSAAVASAPPVTVAASAPPPENDAAAAAGGQAGDASATGDTNQIVDPNCVAKTAAGLLSSGTAPPAGPTCGPMQQPQALKDAEKQISHGNQ